MGLYVVFKTGNIFNSGADLLVNPVNTRGVMGAGLAKQFKQKYKGNFEQYVSYCKSKSYSIERFGVPIFEDQDQLICNFPTKEDWEKPSRLSYIRKGLLSLRNTLMNYPDRDRVTKIAIPALGCGLGGLDPKVVLHLILYHLKFVDFDLELCLYGFDKIPKKIRDFMRKHYDLRHRQHPRFTGVGSRRTTRVAEDELGDVVKVLSRRFALLTCTGDASEGGDKVVWNNALEGHRIRFGPVGRSSYSLHTQVVPPDTEAYSLAVSIVSKLHPAWRFLKQEHRELHIRNVFQVMGATVSRPSEFLLCWTPDGAEEKTSKKTGGTGTAIRIANHFGIPVFNMQNEDCIERLGEYLGVNLMEII